MLLLITVFLGSNSKLVLHNLRRVITFKLCSYIILPLYCLRGMPNPQQKHSRLEARTIIRYSSIMEIPFASCVPCEPSARAKSAIEFIEQEGQNHAAIANFLAEQFPEDFDEVIVLFC
jgi:hypothetical protein